MPMFIFLCLLSFWLLLWKASLADTCSENRVFDLAFKDSAISEFPSADKHHTSEMECATLCYKLYSEKCTAFFYNTNTSSCSIYNSSLSCVMLHHQPGIRGYAYVKHQSGAVSECYDGEIRPLHIAGLQKPVLGYYDSEGWLVIQRRTDGSENFDRTWVEYENGFGNLRNEFWLEEQFREYQQGIQFTTKDVDNDVYPGNVAQLFGGGWWYYYFGNVFLNGRKPCNHANICNRWEKFGYDLVGTQIKIKPA